MIILNRKSIEDVFKSTFIVGCVGRRGNGEEHICELILSSTVGEEWAIVRWMSAVKTKMHDFVYFCMVWIRRSLRMILCWKVQRQSVVPKKSYS